MYREEILADTIIIQRIEDFSLIYEMIRLRDFNKNISIERLKFIYPHHILMLVHYFILQKEEGIEGTLFGSQNTGGYLRAIHLVDFCNTNHKTPKSTPCASTSIPIMRIDTSSLEEYKINFVNFLSAFCYGKDLTMVKLCIDELVNNVYDHSESEIGAYIFCQYYNRLNSFRFTISDIGIGIPDKIISCFPEKEFSSTAALIHALEKGVTTKSNPKNRGFGLDNLFSSLKGMRAMAEIFSSDVYWKLDTTGKMTYSTNPIKHFKGTIVNIMINVSMLNDEEEDIINEYYYN